MCIVLINEIDPMGACIIALGVSISWIKTSHGKLLNFSKAIADPLRAIHFLGWNRCTQGIPELGHLQGKSQSDSL
jgi:hypothetical protein